MQTTTISYPSHDNASTIRALVWEPDDAARPDFSPRAVVQIVHGMSEHVERYAPFAEFLVGRGFVVCANDHVGHGKTAGEHDLGHMPLANGANVLVEDVHALREKVCERYPHARHVMFGHSMGSFVTRVYLTRHADGLSAAILCGTGQQPRIQTVAGRVITRLIAQIRGERHVSRFVDSLGAGAYGRAIKDARTDVDWISSDPDVVDEYIADPLCGQPFTVGAYATLASLVADATDARLARRVPKDLPLLFVAGAEDPVGDCGRGVARAVDEYRNAGVRLVEMGIYPGARHEILNEPCHEAVWHDVEEFLARQGI
uniref:alpha/beta hydrolase n=1 Tax=Parolsenella massiliensis TaxID=1871022 RepID=UPI000933CE59|nr:alpha/beta hydrolase [Parolsenella massiliensis]